MTRDDLRSAVIDALLSVAPEADPARLKPDVSLRDQLDLDSMDLLNFIIALHRALQVDIPEADYRRLMALDGCVTYLEEKLGSTPAGGGR
ncbi:MAG: acyl carrier protein [Acidobacteriota bacterium]|nr:acyl carrier protein [Acidobacteriota bacterium]